MEALEIELFLKQAERLARLEERLTMIEESRDRVDHDERNEYEQNIEDKRESARQKPTITQVWLGVVTALCFLASVVISVLAYIRH